MLSGMGSMQQVVENVATAEHSQPHNLTADEVALVGRVKDAYFSDAVACTGCRYCMPCPNGVEIPARFQSLQRRGDLRRCRPAAAGLRTDETGATGR